VTVENSSNFCSNLTLRDGSQFNINSLSGIEELLPALCYEQKVDTESMAEVITRTDNTTIVTYTDKSESILYPDNTLFKIDYKYGTVESKHKDFFKIIEYSKEIKDDQLVNLLMKLTTNDKVSKLILGEYDKTLGG